MASITIPWNDGPGNIVLTLTSAQGNQTVTVTSDTDCIYHQRQQRVTFVVKDGAIHNDVGTADGHQIRTASGNTIRTLDNSMKVTVMVSVVTPPFSTLFVLSMVTNSGLPACVTARTTSSQLAALNVIFVLRAFRPVLSAPAVTLTVSLPLPDVLLGTSHCAYAIILIYLICHSKSVEVSMV